MRAKIQQIEKDSDFLQEMIGLKTELENQLDILTTSAKQIKGEDVENLVITLHKESLKLRKALGATIKDIDNLQEDEFGLSEEFNDKLLDQALYLHECADLISEKIKKHADASKYGHYTQLHKGLVTFYEALMKFLSNSSKRPRGRLEIVFNNAVEYIAGAQYMAEHSGYELTNGNALNALEKFDSVAHACVNTYGPSDPNYNKVQEMFHEFKKVAKVLFSLATYMKS